MGYVVPTNVTCHRNKNDTSGMWDDFLVCQTMKEWKKERFTLEKQYFYVFLILSKGTPEWDIESYEDGISLPSFDQ